MSVPQNPEVEFPQRRRDVLRWDIQFRIQHVVLFTSVITLLLTGWPLRYHGVGVSRSLVNLWGGLEAASFIHRAAAVVFIGTVIYHVVYLLQRRRQENLLKELMPTRQDFRDVLHMTRYYFGRVDHRPRFGRFTYWEKMDYWAEVWGFGVMASTGLILWYPVAAVSILPVWALDVAKVAHSYEALLAGLALFIWHLYNVHLRSEIFPMDAVWITGRLTQEELKERYPLEYERLLAAGYFAEE